MAKLLSLIFSIFYLPYMVYKEDELGKNWKEKFNFFILFLSIGINFKKRIKVGEIKKITIPLSDKISDVFKMIQHDQDENLNIDQIVTEINNSNDLKIIFTKDFNPNRLNWDDKQLKLKKVINNGGYKDGLNSFITITKDNILLDGNHRVSLLKEKYGNDYDIVVKKSLFTFENLFKRALLKINKKKMISIIKPTIETEFNLSKKQIVEKMDWIFIINIWNNSFPSNKIPIDE